ncbi:uncharacterized protein LOC135956680 [Calliphora vicina]|uniref:uncharacterized protein LOC135956680 n=1 Tax=Calliphora vicina TaxID=7373 RepID=UPI00325A9064
MSGFHPRDLINAIKIRPGIYNRDLLETPPREHKRRLWLEVAEHLTPDEDWESYTDVEKEARVDEISTKWKHMKDHFYREIKLQEAGEAHKKRKYIYFDDMEFMRPFVGYKLPPINKRINKSRESEDFTQDFVGNDTDLDMDVFLKTSDNGEANNSSGQERRTQLKRAVKSTPKVLPNKSGNKNSNTTKKTTETTTNPTFKIRDGDISFCLSLVPTLRKLGDGRKLRAKIEILKVLHRYVEHIERRNLVNRAGAANHKNKSHQNADNEDDMDEDHLEEYEEGVNVKHEQHDDPLNGSEGNTKTWWT